ncbi:MAG: biotin/lipoate A/B protein ligase family protein [Chloroflexota bacterium]
MEAALAVAPWRMVGGYDLPGDYLMALDEALLESVIAGGMPVVRFYTWRPATLSLGVNQPVGEIQPDECARRGFTLVRRLTGGRAVLHQHELTYSVIARENDPRVSGGVIESYRKISAALVDGLCSLGVDVSLAEPSRALYRAMSASRRQADAGSDTGGEGSHGAVCFDTASAYEITASGRKLVGSAQARRGGAILQHGSILLDIDWDAWVSVFSYATEEGKQRAYTKLPSRMTSLKHEFGRVVAPEEVQQALVRGFERNLKVELIPSLPSEAEEAHAQQLLREKYSTEAWTNKT